MIIVIGNGVAGITCAQVVREKDRTIPILVITEEKYPYYARPQIIEFLAGKIGEEELPFYPSSWYQEKKIDVVYGEKGLSVDLDKQILLTTKDKYKYSKLLIATGAKPSKPPLENIDAKGVFTLRNIDDAKEILDYIKGKEKVVILGCGLLGLEVGRALSQRGLKVVGIEFFQRLIPRQLDEEGAKIFQRKLQEKFGFEFYLGAKAKKVIAENNIFKGIELEDGRKILGDLLIVSAGIIPEIDIAKKSGIEVNKGIIVNEYMETNVKYVYSAGDCVEYSGRIYGIIPASLEQGSIAGKNMVGEKTVYTGTIPFNTLKITGISLASMGNIEYNEPNAEIFVLKDEEKGFYRKLIFVDNVIVGAILLENSQKYINKIKSLISSKKIIEKKDEILYEE
ncbi:MAG: nitrite reductase [Dictyoglomus sp. NZ13-RE01]|nr:MAG: nitrite reductase [Dictyoglomus sp. NZ13-RE01]